MDETLRGQKFLSTAQWSSKRGTIPALTSDQQTACLLLQRVCGSFRQKEAASTSWVVCEGDKTCAGEISPQNPEGQFRARPPFRHVLSQEEVQILGEVKAFQSQYGCGQHSKWRLMEAPIENNGCW